jgi:hypothetical protein
MGITVGNKKIAAFDDLDHYFDPRNTKCNPKVTNSSSTSTVYADVFRNKIPFNVSYHEMLHADGYLDFPVPTIGGNGSSGEQGTKYRARFGDTATYNSGNQQLLEMDTTTGDGYCWMQWINVNKIPPINTAIHSNQSATSIERRRMQLFVEDQIGGSRSTDDRQFYLDWYSSEDTDQSTDPDFKYNLGVKNRSASTAASAEAQNVYYGQDKIGMNTWICIAHQGSLYNTTNGGFHQYSSAYNYIDVWIDDSKVLDNRARTYNAANEPQAWKAIWRLKWLGSQEQAGQSNYSTPGLSFVGSMGPSVFWNKRLTDAEYLEAYNYFLNRLPT